MGITNIRDGADRRSDNRDAMDRLLARAEHLHPDERALVKAVYERGVSVTDLALAMRRPRSTIQRQVSRVLKRLSGDEFLFVMRHGRRWPDERRAVAEAVLVRGRSQREAARQVGVSVHRVRQHLGAVRLMHEQQGNESHEVV